MKHACFALLIQWHLAPCTPATEPIDLLKDRHFAEGFGAGFIYGKRDEDGVRRSYRDIHPWQIHLIPEGPVKQLSTYQTHPWDFQEGLHHNYTDKRGRRIGELHAHRLVVNHTIEANTPEKLQFVQYNNDGLPKGDPERNTRLVKRITTDRQGHLRILYNSQNEIRNAAIGHSARWARDTWPHLLVNQRFDDPIALADFERLDFTVSYQVNRMDQLSNWPNAIKGAARSGMNLKFMFFLRNQSNPDQKLFAGMMLFTSRAKAWAPHLGVEQHGNVFYRESVAPEGVNPPQLGESRTVDREIKSMLSEALRQAHEEQPHLSTNLADYALHNFSIGLEGMGHWESECEIRDLRLQGYPKPAR